MSVRFAIAYVEDFSGWACDAKMVHTACKSAGVRHEYAAAI